MYYLYRHIRLDKDQPFYIGIGHNTENSHGYNRAFSKKRRSNFWKQIVNKTDYEVEILMESENESFIFEKEIEFVKLYGRRDLNLGTLVNLTNGGRGTTKVILSEKNKYNNRTRNIGLVHSTESKKLMSEGAKRSWSLNKKSRKPITTILQYDNRGNFVKECKIKDITRELNILESNISFACNSKRKTGLIQIGGFYWRKKEDNYSLQIDIGTRGEILQYSKDMVLIKEWESAAVVQRELGFNHRAIRFSCRKLNKDNSFKTAYGFIWRYKKSIV